MGSLDRDEQGHSRGPRLGHAGTARRLAPVLRPQQDLRPRRDLPTQRHADWTSNSHTYTHQHTHIWLSGRGDTQPDGRSHDIASDEAGSDRDTRSRANANDRAQPCAQPHAHTDTITITITDTNA